MEKKMKYRIVKKWKTDALTGKEVNVYYDCNMKYTSNEIMRLIKSGYNTNYVGGLYCMIKVERIGVSEIKTFMILEEV